MTAVPVIRIDLESMRHSIAMAFSQHMVEIDADVQAALKAAIDGFDIRSEVRRLADVSIREALKAAIEHEFRYGAAAQVIGKKVAEMAVAALKNVASPTP